MESLTAPTNNAKPISWVGEIVAAFENLGGAARYDDLYEYIQRTTGRELTKQWKATVRRTIEDHSSDSKNFRSDDIFHHLDLGFWSLRTAGDMSALVHARASQKAKTVVDDILAKAASAGASAKVVFVEEHWRRWPSKKSSDPLNLTLDAAVFSIADGWVTDRHIELKSVSGLVLKVPLNWFPTLKTATRKQLSQFEVGEYGIHWPAMNFQILVPEIFSSGKVAVTTEKDV